MSVANAILRNLTAMVVISFAPSAMAAGTEKPERYEYKFTDDKLLGAEQAPMGDLIPGPRLGRRDRLVRPRTQFVLEMLTSIENM
jgi:hypothetical protein